MEERLLRRLRALAKSHFDVARFRPGQVDVMEAVLAGRDAVAVMPTGGGKSLCFQLPALLNDKPVLVVSPLLSLMQDQQKKLDEASVSSEQLSSALTKTQTDAAKDAIAVGEASIIYVTPERLQNPEYLKLLKARGVSLFVVDEAHCVAQWGHDFRPAYLALRDAAVALGRPPILALTATATPEVFADITEQLAMRFPVYVTTGMDRPNLFLEVRATPSEEHKRKTLLELLHAAEGTGIIYVATVRLADELHAWLRGQGINSGVYHGRMAAKARKQAQEAFMANAFDVLVATNAFGLGVDKADVRFVIHYTFPSSLESYFQEAGRAGRDGKSARTTLLYRLEDRRVQAYFLGGKYPKRQDCLNVYRALQEGTPLPELGDRKRRVIFAHLESAGIVVRRRRAWKVVRAFASGEELEAYLSAYEKRHTADTDKLDTMMRYAETGQCRGRFVLAYFGEDPPDRCGHCDVCLAQSLSVAQAA